MPISIGHEIKLQETGTKGTINIPDIKVHGAIMEPILGRQYPGGSHVGPMNFAIWDCM